MTSGNSTDEPIAIGNDEARERLGGLADGLLLHDREIISRYDDSVVRLVGGEPHFLRRARGYAPLPLALAIASPVPLLAVGADLKNTFALVEGSRVYLSQHIGDLEDFPTQEHFRDTLQRFRALFQVTPELVVRDLHPGYHSTRLAADLAPSRVIAVQHHHAHVAAVLAEHGAEGPALGVAYDGTGYGDDGQVWGGELLLADLTGYRRLAHLRYAPLPGGDLVARQPWRAALGYLSLDPSASAAFELAFVGIDPQARALATLQIARSINAPRASSMGRLFDAASAVLGLRHHSGHEGQAAMELEALAGRLVGHALPFPLRPGTDGVWELDPLPLLTALGAYRARGDDPAQLAADFHASLIVGTEEMVTAAADVTGVRTVVLSGGVFQNARLMALLPERLEARGLTVLRPRRLSPNDGAISYGQAAVAAAILSREGTTMRGAT
jgi:hydrogenase maturation protein HypF